MEKNSSKILDQLIELVAWLLNAGHVIYIWQLYSDLPEKIPIHFNLKGIPDTFGNKLYIWLLPAISIIIVTGLTLLEELKHEFNFLSPVTPENAQLKQLQAIRLIRALKLAVTGIFLYITIHIVNFTGLSAENQNLWFVVIPVFLVPFYFLFSSRAG